MKTALLIIMQLAASGSDAYYTHRCMQFPVHSEKNPIARQFVGSTSGQVFYFSAGAALKIVGAYWLRKHHHQKWADVAAVTGVADSAGGALYSATHAY